MRDVHQETDVHPATDTAEARRSSAAVFPRDWPSGLAHSGRLAYVEERLGATGFTPTRRQRMRRVAFYVLLTWVAPFCLSFVPSGGARVVPFAFDVEAHVRGLVAIPLLLLAEWPIELRLRAVMRRLGSPPLATRRVRALVEARIHWARRLAGHPLAEGLLLVAALAIGYEWLIGHQIGRETWISTPREAVEMVTPAGAWAAGVVVPVYAFLLMRWIWRWLVLTMLFARISRLPLRLASNHGDRAAGLSFVSEPCMAFGGVLMAASSVACAKWMDGILYAGISPGQVLPIMQATLVVGPLLAFLPVAAFVPRLLVTRRRALRRYTDIVAKHGAAVETRWDAPGDNVNADDAGSMADLNSVHAAVRGIRIVPVAVSEVLAVVVVTALPMVPIAVQIVPAKEIAMRFLKALV